MWKHFGTDLDKRTVIHAWLSTATVVDATSKGYRVIWSVDGQYYLDALNEVWQKFYDVDLLAGVTSPAAQALMLGGETVRGRGRAGEGAARTAPITVPTTAAPARAHSTNRHAPACARTLTIARLHRSI